LDGICPGERVDWSPAIQAAKDSGLQYYQYDTDTNEFAVRSLLDVLNKQ